MKTLKHFNMDKTHQLSSLIDARASSINIENSPLIMEDLAYKKVAKFSDHQNDIFKLQLGLERS